MKDSLVRCVLVGVLGLAGCTREARSLGPTPPQSAPHGANDPRIGDYLGSVFQIGQGGTYFVSYGCSSCHDSSAPDLRRARLPVGMDFARIYQEIAEAHGTLAYGRRIPVEQLWQLTAYVADLPSHTPEKRRRTSVDQAGEPAGATWAGPLR